MIKRRNRFKQVQKLEERLADEAVRLREQAKLLPHGVVREEVMRKARQCETGAHMSDWLRSPGLKGPTKMAGYYAYIIGDDGHIESRVDIRCDDDEEAKRLAQKLADGHDVELWQQARKVASFKARSSCAPHS